MNIRRVTSLTAALAFLLMILTSIVLYIVPQGRVAYWANWKLWGLSKTDWGNIHITLGFLFLVALGLHIYYNWTPLIAYLKNKARRLTVLTPEFNIALLLTTACLVGTYFSVPPFSWVITLNDHFKDNGARKYGEPPYGHAELSSLKTFAKKMNLDLEKSIQELDKAGYGANGPTTTLMEIAEKYNLSPQRVYETFKSAAIQPLPSQKEAARLPETPPPGTGNLTINELITRYGIDRALVLHGLDGLEIQVSADETLKQIAARNQTNPIELYERIKTAIQK